MHRPIAIFGLLCLILGPSLTYARILPPMAGVVVFAASGLLGLVAVLWSLAGLFRGQGGRALGSMFLGLVPVAGLATLAVGANQYPRINDVSTDLDDPPALVQTPTYPAELVPIVRASYPELAPWILDAPADVVFQQALDLVASRPGWSMDRADGRAMTDLSAESKALAEYRPTHKVRFVDVVLAAPVPMLLWWGRDSIQIYNDAARRVMDAAGIRINDLYAFARPRLAGIQIPQNVHFTPAGSAELADPVARDIREALRQRRSAVSRDLRSPASPTPNEFAAREKWVKTHLDSHGDRLPFTFQFDGCASTEFLKKWPVQSTSRKLDDARSERTLAWTDPRSDWWSVVLPWSTLIIPFSSGPLISRTRVQATRRC